jgi:hypothetical protein
MTSTLSELFTKYKEDTLKDIQILIQAHEICMEIQKAYYERILERYGIDKEGKLK